MSRGFEANVSISVGMVYRVAKAFSKRLTMPRAIDDSGEVLELNARECRAYIKAARQVETQSINGFPIFEYVHIELVLVAQAMTAVMSSYMWQAICDANALNLTGSERLCFLRKQSKAFRLTFC